MKRNTALLLAALVLLVTTAGCARAGRPNLSSPEVRATVLRRIAENYANTSDLEVARSALADTGLANPVQLLVSLAEQDVNEGRPPEEVQQVSDLAAALGARSPMVVAYLAPPAADEAAPQITTPTATATLVPATATAVPAPVATAPPAAAPAATAADAAPAKPRAAARDAVNLRSGPGTGYPVIGQMQAGSALDIVGRNASGDWWRVAYPSEEQAWVASLIVDVTGPIDTVALVKDIPVPPAAPTAAPVVISVPTEPPAAQAAPQPTAKPKAPDGVQYVVQSLRLRSTNEGQACAGGNHVILATVLDADGKPLDGVSIRNLLFVQYGIADAIQVSGRKGPGSVEWVMDKNGGGQLDIIDGNGNRISDVTRAMSNAWPDLDLMQAAGYCACESLDGPACQAALENHSKLFAWGHYTYEVVFRRVS